MGTVDPGNHDDLHDRRGQPREEVERTEPEVTHRVFDVVSKDPEEPDVADEVAPASVKEHRRDRDTTPRLPTSHTRESERGHTGHHPRAQRRGRRPSCTTSPPRARTLKNPPDHCGQQSDQDREDRYDLGGIVVA